MPQEPCLPAPRAVSRALLAARWYGVVTSALRSTVSRSSASRTPRAARCPASAISASGSTSTCRDRCVRTPRGERSGAELGEGVVPPVGGDHVVRGLRAAVEADHRVDRLLPAAAGAEPVHDGALA